MARDMIFRRRKADFRRDGGLLELMTRTLAAAVHAANGNKKGLDGAARIRFFEDDSTKLADLPSTEGLVAMMGAPQIDLDAELARMQEAGHGS